PRAEYVRYPPRHIPGSARHPSRRQRAGTAPSAPSFLVAELKKASRPYRTSSREPQVDPRPPPLPPLRVLEGFEQGSLGAHTKNRHRETSPVAVRRKVGEE